MNLRTLVLVWAACLVVLLPSLAEPLDTHRALFQLFCPGDVWSERADELTHSSWDEIRKNVPQGVWTQLEPLGELELKARRAAFAGLAKSPTTAPLHLFLRRFYLLQLYAADKGLAWAGLPSPPVDPRAVSKPEFPATWLKLEQNRILPSQGEIDYLIVGSGPAGSVLAYELSRAGFRTVLAERGSFVLPDMIDTRLVGELKVGGGAVPTQGSSVLVRNGMTVGGGSTVNVDLAFAPTLPFVQEKIEQWREAGHIARDQWTLPEVKRAYAWVTEKMQTRELETSEINPNNRVLWTGAKALGLDPQLYDLNALANNDGRRNKRSAVNSLLLEAMSRESNPLIVLPDLSADKVLTDGKRATGVLFSKGRPWHHSAVLSDPSGLKLKEKTHYEIRARRVILCAGSQGTAAILLRSGLGGPEVGRGLVLHPSMPLIGWFERKIGALEGTPSSVYVEDDEDEQGTLYECMSGDPEYVALMLFGTGDEIAERLKDFNRLAGFGFLLVDSVTPENRVALDEEGQAEIIYEFSAKDKERLRKAASKSVKMMLAAGAKEVYLPTSELEEAPGRLKVFRKAEDIADVDKIRFLPARTILTSAHMQSSCKMGEVVDQSHRVLGTENLYICDSSIFPSSVGANPMQTIYTVAKLFSEKLIGVANES